MAKGLNRAPKPRMVVKGDNRRRSEKGKPHSDFPLIPRADGRWCKKVRGTVQIFNSTADEALKEVAYRPPAAVYALARKEFARPQRIFSSKPHYSASTTADLKSPPEFLETPTGNDIAHQDGLNP